MKTENLSCNLSVKNYKKMCVLIGEEIKTGKSKQYQLENWKRYFNYNCEGHKFIILEIYENPKPKTSKKVENSIYAKFIELLLMYELSTKEGYTCNYTKKLYSTH